MTCLFKPRDDELRKARRRTLSHPNSGEATPKKVRRGCNQLWLYRVLALAG